MEKAKQVRKFSLIGKWELIRTESLYETGWDLNFQFLPDEETWEFTDENILRTYRIGREIEETQYFYESEVRELCICDDTHPLDHYEDTYEIRPQTHDDIQLYLIKESSCYVNYIYRITMQRLSPATKLESKRKWQIVNTYDRIGNLINRQIAVNLINETSTVKKRLRPMKR